MINSVSNVVYRAQLTCMQEEALKLSWDFLPVFLKLRRIFFLHFLNYIGIFFCNLRVMARNRLSHAAYCAFLGSRLHYRKGEYNFILDFQRRCTIKHLITLVIT